MNIVNIRDYLDSIDVTVDGICLGDFDSIGKFTAEKQRSREEENFKRCGAFYKSDYERGILASNLIQRFNLTSVLEIGFGRGYFTFCCAKTFYDLGAKGTITTIDPQMNKEWIEQLTQVFPREWFSYVKFVKDTSQHALPESSDKFDLIYIDGDSKIDVVKNDWALCKDRFNKFCLFNDYRISPTDALSIERKQFVDGVAIEKLGIRTDRRMFMDERGFTDEQVDYCHVLFGSE